MNRGFIVLLTLLVSPITSRWLPEYAGRGFLNSMMKHGDLKDEGIFDKDFCVQFRDGYKASREESIERWFAAHDEDRDTESQKFISEFTSDGMLKMKVFRDGKFKAYYLGKPDKNIEGGYSLYRIVIV